MTEYLKDFETKMSKTISALMHELDGIRAGRANPAILDKIHVDYYGVPTQINAMAAISVPEARMLVIQPWDKSTLKAIEKAIQTSDIGINPQNDGSVLRLAFPPLTEERRKELAKQVTKKGEDSKVAIRTIRRDAIEKFKALQKKSEITEDDLKEYEKEAQILHDKFIKEIDDIIVKKGKEIMEV
ncbi:Ribosome-recycling factor [bioreactor metagenome]|uniref:Ribosome-recycling factor n=1 Tax=bioreactor metagenome TaxID=1076179 RepID=A0A645BY68_9ZZZZ